MGYNMGKVVGLWEFFFDRLKANVAVLFTNL